MEVEEFLDKNNIKYIHHEHPAVYTCEEAKQYNIDLPGMACKNLFLRDKKGKRYFLVILPASKQADLKRLAEILGVNKISFASSEALKDKLGLEAGAVSPFGLINDANNGVELFIDQEVYNAPIVNFHPNVNTASLELSQEMFREFLKVINRQPNVIIL